MAKTRQTLASFEASARARARMRKPRLVASDLVASAATKAANRWAPELGSFVTILMPHDLSAATPSPAKGPPDREQQQRRQQEEPTEGPQDERVEPEQTQTHQQLHAHQDVHTQEESASSMWQRLLAARSVLGAELKKGEIAQGILVGRSSDGWYQVLLVEVNPHSPRPRAPSPNLAPPRFPFFCCYARPHRPRVSHTKHSFVCNTLRARVAKTTESNTSSCLE